MGFDPKFTGVTTLLSKRVYHKGPKPVTMG
jgi:hypothetical protein